MKLRLLPIMVLALSVALGGASSRAAEDEPGAASVTVFPVATKPHQLPGELAKRIGIAVATLLEKAGVEQLEIADTFFTPPETDDVGTIAKAFGKWGAAQPIKTEYAVFAQFVGTPETGVKAIRTIVVNQSGEVLLADSAGKAELDKAPIRPKDPLTCCVFVSRRLRDLWQLRDPLRPGAPSGKMARFWREDAGIPPKDELEAIARRAEILKKSIETATCTVYPIRAGSQPGKQCAADLAAMLNETGVGRAEVSRTDPDLKIASHSNEQKVLWDTARAFRDFVKRNPPTTDYAVYADYGLSDTEAHYVHAIVCTRSGQWVLIEMQNSHHPTFQQIDPKSAADCNRLLLERLKDWLNK